MSITGKMLDCALWYARHGWPVFPCKPKTKIPLVDHGVKEATTNEAIIRTWWLQNPDANIGGACGVQPLNIVVLDEDINPNKGKYGDESLKELENEFGQLPDTWTSLTGGGGVHHVFKYDHPETLKNGVDIRNGLDIRTTGGYIVLPPSIHESGREYAWDEAFTPWNTPIAELPDFLRDIIKPKEFRKSEPIAETFGEGERNDKLFRMASSLRAKGLSEDEIYAAVSVANNTRCNPPLEDFEIRNICKSAGKYSPGSIVPAIPKPSEAAEIVIPDFTKNDFYTTAPFEFLFQFRGNKLLLEQMTQKMVELSKKVGVKGFLKMFSGYMADNKKYHNEEQRNVTAFDGQQQEYFCGSWTATEDGITGVDRFGMPVVACYHPILPIERVVNVDTGIHKVRLAYRLSNKWRDVIEDKSTISDGRSIITLAKYGINVTSDNAKSLVRFLADVEHQNYDRIPEVASVGRLGWIDGYGFSPYGDQLVFDGMDEYRNMFESVQEHGDYKKWLECVRELRQNDTFNGKVVRVMLAASFSSVLVRILNALPFFVHVWGKTGAGKSVALMLATSVWANPEMGRYAQTFNSTDVGKEMTAAFCNSLPLVIDELQIVKDQKKDFDRMVYQLTQGAGRTRGRKSGGLQQTPTWRNCILTSGEFPITSDNSGGGTANRVLEIEYQDGKLIEDGVKVASALRENYGFAGKDFVSYLTQDGNAEKVKEIWEKIYQSLKEYDTMEKQAASAAVVLTADKLIDEWIFKDSKTLTAGDLSIFLKTKDEIDQNARAYEFIQGFVEINATKFRPETENGEIWGKIEGETACIINTKFYHIMDDEGYNAKSFLTWAKKQGVIELSSDGKTTVPKYIGARTVRCVCIKLEQLVDGELEML